MAIPSSAIGARALPATISPTIRFASELTSVSALRPLTLNHSGWQPMACRICPSTLGCQ